MANSKLAITIPRAILSFLWEVGEGSAKAFFPHPYFHTFCHHSHRQNIHNSFYNLKKKGLIKKEGRIYRLTPIGKEKAFWAHLATALEEKKSDNPGKWDGYWRIVIFDIAEKKRALRDELRGVLKIIGFKELQKSIWVYPYEFPKLIKELISQGNIGRETRLLTIKEINYDRDIRKKFKIT